jgi:hypothetical protein
MGTTLTATPTQCLPASPIEYDLNRQAPRRVGDARKGYRPMPRAIGSVCRYSQMLPGVGQAHERLSDK